MRRGLQARGSVQSEVGAHEKLRVRSVTPTAAGTRAVARAHPTTRQHRQRHRQIPPWETSHYHGGQQHQQESNHTNYTNSNQICLLQQVRDALLHVPSSRGNSGSQNECCAHIHFNARKIARMKRTELN